MSQTDTPYWKGQKAYEAGTPIDDNPYRKGAPFDPEDWPGDYGNWRSGWIHACHVKTFTKTQRGGTTNERP